jgi:hypothetical protein
MLVQFIKGGFMKKVLSVLCTVFAFAAVCLGTPIKLSLWDKIAVPNSDSVCGLEIGIGTYTPNFRGVGWNIIYSQTDDAKAWQAGIVTISKQFVGLQTGFLFMSETFKGVSFGAVNWNEGEVTGVQWGFFNIAKSVSGLQLGFLNMTENMNGIQIGFLNFIKDSKLPVMIIANARF